MLTEEPGRWSVTNKAGETLVITITEVISDSSVDLGVDPGLVKDGVEAHLQELLAAQLGVLGDGWRLVRREYPTPIGPVDLMCRDDAGHSVAVEIKRRSRKRSTDGQRLTRYLELLNRDPLLVPVHGVFAAQEIRPQASAYGSFFGLPGRDSESPSPRQARSSRSHRRNRSLPWRRTGRSSCRT